MSNETPEIRSISEMVRTTIQNSEHFYSQIANYIDNLEQTVVELQSEIAKLKGETNDE